MSENILGQKRRIYIDARLYLGANVQGRFEVTQERFNIWAQSALGAWLKGWTVFHGMGQWSGTQEPMYVVEIIQPEDATNQAFTAEVRRAADSFRREFNQREVLVSFSEVEQFTIGDEIKSHPLDNSLSAMNPAIA